MLIPGKIFSFVLIGIAAFFVATHARGQSLAPEKIVVNQLLPS